MKDLIYWLIIVTLFSLLSSDIGQYNSLLLDNWTFAGTIISIILAVIAILYTFDQSSTTVASTKNLEKSAKRVEEATKKLENNNINIIITDLEERLSGLLQEMKQGIDENITTNFEPLKNFMDSHKDVPSLDKNTQILSIEEWKKYLKNIVVNGLTTEGVTLIYSYFLYKNGLNYNVSSTRKWLANAIKDNDHISEFTGIIEGQMRLFSSLNVFTYERLEMGGDHKFTNYNEGVYEELNVIVEKGEGDFNYILETLKNYFEVQE